VLDCGTTSTVRPLDDKLLVILLDMFNDIFSVYNWKRYSSADVVMYVTVSGNGITDMLFFVCVISCFRVSIAVADFT